MLLNSFVQTLTVAGRVDPGGLSFSVKARSGDTFEAIVGPATDSTIYTVLTNLDEVNRDGVKDPKPARGEDDAVYNLRKYVQVDRHVVVRGFYQENGSGTRYQARQVWLLHSEPHEYLFEATHWWPTQTTQMADRILDYLFDARRNYSIDDFSKLYRTNLNIYGQDVDDTTQECAVLSRLSSGPTIFRYRTARSPTCEAFTTACRSSRSSIRRSRKR